MSRLHRGWTWLLPAAVVLAAGCTTGGDSVIQPKNNVQDIAWNLKLNHKAITMVVGDVVQLQATPLNLKGETVSGLPPVVYTVSDTAVHVDSTGKVTCNSARPDGVLIYATVTDLAGNFTLADTAQIAVLDAPYPAFSSFKMVLSGPTLAPAGDERDFNGVLFDASGNALLDTDGDTIYPMTYYSTPTPKAIFNLFYAWYGGGYGNNLGSVQVLANALIFGHEYNDSVSLQITYPDTGTLYIFRESYSQTPSPSQMGQTNLTILQNGVVHFYNENTTQNVDIQFDDQTHVVGGNISAVSTSYPGSTVAFPTVGKYTYHSDTLGVNGTITVVSGP